MKRIVITGMGLLSPLGYGIKNNWEAMKSGKYGINETELLDEKLYSERLYGVIDHFDFAPFLAYSDTIGRSSAFGITAAKEALEQAALLQDQKCPQKIGVVVGSLTGENSLRELPLAKTKNKNPLFYNPLISQNIANWFGLVGPNSTTSTACSSSGYAVAYASQIIEHDLSDIMLVGGVESIALTGQAVFISVKGIDSERIRPFDKNRQGTIFAEGAAFLVIESLDSAKSRGASILAEVKGIGKSCDGYNETAPDPEGFQILNAMKRAIEQSSLLPNDIDCISVHGTGTFLNDKTETKAIKNLFGEYAENLSLTSVKSMFGHGVGSACNEQIIGAVHMLNHSLVTPTINFECADPECDLDYTFNIPRKRDMDNILINSNGFGGNNISLVISKFK